MPFKNDGKQTQEYVYDVAVDGGAAGTYQLDEKAGSQKVPVGAIITSVYCVVNTAFAGGTAVSWGSEGDPDGYSGTAIVDATLVGDFLVNGHDLGAALLWDDTNDHKLTPLVTSDATGSMDVLTTGTHTAGKMTITVEFTYPNS